MAHNCDRKRHVRYIYFFLFLLSGISINISVTGAEWKPLRFRIPSSGLWQQPEENSYTATGSVETFAWSDVEISGDFALSVDIESSAINGEGVIIVYGNGSYFSKGCLIFNISHDYQAIRADTIDYRQVKWLAKNQGYLNFQNQKYTMTIEVSGEQASLFINGKKTLSAKLPHEIKRQGRIGLYKYHERPSVTFSNIVLNAEYSSDSHSLHEEKKFALVLGNGAYDDIPLQNPVHDAEAISRALRAIGFRVIMKTNATRRTMEEAMNEFFTEIQDGDIALFYYSGHGIQVKGENYLLPVGEHFQSETDIRYQAINLGYILGNMEESGNRTNILILDACRNNPFKSIKKSLVFGDDQGLSSIDAPGGTFIAYATAPGSVAVDGIGENSPYTAHLIKALSIRGIPIEQTFKHVLRAVEKETDGGQIPWISSSLREDVYLNP